MPRRLAPALLLAALLGAARADEAADLAAEVGAEVLRSAPAGERGDALRVFYALGGDAPAWFAYGSPTRQARQAVSILCQADGEGLVADDYGCAPLRAALRDAPAAADGARRVARLDVTLSRAMLRYMADLHTGRIDPRRLHLAIERPHAAVMLAETLRNALGDDRLSAAVGALAPAIPMYQRLRIALVRYRALAADETLTQLPPVRKLQPAMAYAGLGALRRLLVALGDLSPTAPATPRYAGELVDAVRRFQARHGLDADGVIGARTLAELTTPLSRRVRQIELALERLRWIPPLHAAKILAINIPEFRLRAYQVDGGRPQPRLSMRVITGRALDTETPVFVDELPAIEFSPYWNVPASIARAEILPKLRRDPGYLRREEMEFVGAGRAAGASDAVTPSKLAALERGELRLRQRPGAKNALGGIKFVLLNSMSVYMHDTPAQTLFRRSRRDFSHGCIRLEDPVALARFVLDDQPRWTEQSIRAEMNRPRPLRVDVTQPVAVLVFYATALVEEDGSVLFLPDIYGLDQRLDDNILTTETERRRENNKLNEAARQP